MTVDYQNPRFQDYKMLIRLDADLMGDIRIATVCGELKKAAQLKHKKKLVSIRIRLIEVAFYLKEQNKKATADTIA